MTKYDKWSVIIKQPNGQYYQSVEVEEEVALRIDKFIQHEVGL